MNTKMKVLSLALIGAFGYVGAATAACPAGPTTAEGGAWSSKSTLGGALAISTPGFDGTECKLDASITINGPNMNAFVRDDTPSAEPRYRAQFSVDADQVSGLTSIQSVKVFSANSESTGGELVRFNVLGNFAGTQTVLGIAAYCPGEVGDICSDSAILSAGVNKVEIDWDSASNSLKIWVNSNSEAAVTKTISTNVSSASTGVDFAVLGLAAPSAGFRANQLNKIISFDSFDSRRQTFIGY